MGRVRGWPVGRVDVIDKRLGCAIVREDSFQEFWDIDFSNIKLKSKDSKKRAVRM